MTDQAPLTEEDREIMGTPENAKADLIDKARRWRELRQPSMDTAANHRKIEARERETRFQLANAALLWLWHEENTRPTPSERPVPDYEAAGICEVLREAKKAANEKLYGKRPVAQMREALELADKLERTAYQPTGDDEELIIKALRALTSEHPSEAAVAWRWRYKGSKGDWDYSASKPKFASFNEDSMDCEPLYAIPHGDAVRESTETSDEYTKLADEVQEMIETDDMAESDAAKAKLILIALREAASRLASERVSERETMTSVPADGVIGELPSEAVAEIARLRNELAMAKDGLREFVEAYKHQDCASYQDEMARAYGIADANLSLPS